MGHKNVQHETAVHAGDSTVYSVGSFSKREYKRLLAMPSKSSILLIYDITAHTKTLLLSLSHYSFTLKLELPI